MDHLMSLRNTYPPDTTAEFHSSGVDFFSSQGSSFPATSYGQQSSANPHGGNQPAYSLSADLQHGHTMAQSYQPNMSEGQMASAFMCHNPPQPVSDHYYSFQTPALYQQKHQTATNQLIQNPASPCHNQTYSVSMHQNQNSQFISLPGHPQSPQMSPRHFPQQQTPQIMVYNQKSPQIPSSPNHQTSVLISGSAQSQRLNQSPKQIVSKQQNNPKDRTCDAQFYSNQILQRSDSSVNSMHKSQASISKFVHTAQPAQFFHNGGMNSENKVNSDSQLRNIQGSHYGNSMKVQSSNLSKPSVYSVSQSSFEHMNTSVPSNLQQTRYESIVNNSQRMQKASSSKPGVQYMPEVTKNRKYSANFILPDYNSNCPSSSKTPPNKLSPDPSSGAFAYVQNMHYKPRNTHETLLDNRESEKVISRNASARSARPVPGGSEHLESHLNDLLYSNSYALPSIAALVESTKESSRQNKVNDNTNRSNKSNGQIPIAHQNTNETVSPVYWFKNPDSSLASSFQSDIEAMQADIASYAINNRMSRAPVRASPVSHQAAMHRSTESHASGQSGPTQAAQMSEMKKTGNVSRVEQQPNTLSSPVRVRSSKADALAAIQIKQELVESMSRYKSSSPNSTNINSSSGKAASQTSSMKTDTPSFLKDVPVSTNKLPSSVKDQVENIPSQQQLDFNARRHSLSETNKAKQPVSASPNSFLHTAPKPSKTSEYVADTAAASYLRHQSMVDQTIQSGQQIIQTRRNTTPSLLDRSSASIYNAAYSPDERQNMDRYRSPVGAQAMGSQNPTSQNSIHHLVEQVQSIHVPYPHVQQQQHITTAMAENKQGVSASPVDKTGQGQPKLAEETLRVKQPPLSAALSNGTQQQMAPAKNTVIKMEQSDVSRKSASVICYVMLHDYQLICLKSSSEKLLLLCQFQVSCFPDKSLQNVNICIDQTLQIKRRLLNHQDTDKVVLFLRQNGFRLGNVLQTITLYDARRVYHYLYGITNCTHASCIAEVFNSEVDHNTQVPSLCASSVRKELKKEASSDESNSGQFVPAKLPETNIITRLENFLNTVNHNGTKPASSQMPTSLPHSSKDSLKINQGVAQEMDSDDSDDLILVEASEDPHVIRWSGNAPKVGGICNTIIGQLRSYVHENERFLVVDDLCRVFGTTDFYDGVEKENIILYSCCPEIAQFLNAMHKNFPPLQSQHHSLVKEKDIGIHIIDSDYTPGSNGFEKDKMGSQTLKRILCKQEIVDDDCSSPKQVKLGDSVQVLETNKHQSSTMVQPLLLNQGQSEDSVRDLNSSSLQASDITEQQNANKLVPKLEVMNRVVRYTENETSDSCEDTSQSSVVTKSPSHVVKCKNDQTIVNSSSLEADVRDIQDAQVDEVYSCERTGSDRLSSNSFKETAETPLKNQSASQISQCVASEQQSKSVTGGPEMTADIANAPASAAEISILQPSQSSSVESSRQTDTAVDILSPSIVELNSNESLLTIKGEETELPQQESPSLTKTACENISDMQSAHISVLNSHGSTGDVDNQEQGTVDKNNDNSQASVNKEAEDLKFSSLSSFEDLIVSNPTSSILKTRVEKLKYIFETRKNKNLPLPRLTLDSRLNLHLLTNDCVGSEDKSSVPGTSVTDLAMERSSSTDSSRDCSNNKVERLQISSDTNCVNSAVRPGSHSPGQDNADVNFLERSKSPVATNCSKNESSDVRISCDPSSVEQQREFRPHEDYSSDDLPSQGTVETPFAKYFSKSRRALDDSDVMLSRNIDPLEILPSQCWKEYSKLFQEHRALQGLVGELRKSIAHEKAEKEKSEKITKYYEGVINDITSTIKYGGEDTPVVIDDDFPDDFTCIA